MSDRRPYAEPGGAPMCSHLVCPQFSRDRCGELDRVPDALCLPAVRDMATALSKLNAIRNDIIGRQSIGWSRHIYPLVAALNAAGIKGEGYDVMRPRVIAEHRDCECWVADCTVGHLPFCPARVRAS